MLLWFSKLLGFCIGMVPLVDAIYLTIPNMNYLGEEQRVIKYRVSYIDSG